MSIIQLEKGQYRRVYLLHPTKTAGTSVKLSLGAKTRGHFCARSYLPIKNDLVITTVRNPYDRVLSMYNHFGCTMVDSFESFLKLIKSSKDYIFYAQYRYLHKDSFVIRLESIESDFNDFCKKNNISAELQKVNVTFDLKKTFLSDLEKKEIAAIYKKDFETFNYEI